MTDLIDRLQGDWVYQIDDQPLAMATRFRIEGMKVLWGDAALPVVALNDIAIIDHGGRSKMYVNRGDRSSWGYPEDTSFPFILDLGPYDDDDKDHVPGTGVEGIMLREEVADQLLREWGVKRADGPQNDN